VGHWKRAQIQAKGSMVNDSTSPENSRGIKPTRKSVDARDRAGKSKKKKKPWVETKERMSWPEGKGNVNWPAQLEKVGRAGVKTV